MGKDNMEESHIFNGNVLAVKEAPEPSEVFWEDVDVGFKTRMIQQFMGACGIKWDMN